MAACRERREAAGRVLVDVYLPGILGEPRQAGVDAPLSYEVHIVEQVRHDGGLVHPGQGQTEGVADTILEGGEDQLAGVLGDFDADGVLGAGEPLPLQGEHEGLLGEGSPHADPVWSNRLGCAAHKREGKEDSLCCSRIRERNRLGCVPRRLETSGRGLWVVGRETGSGPS